MQPTDSWAQDWFQVDLGIELTSKIRKKNIKDWEEQLNETKVSQHLQVTVMWKADSLFPFTVLSATCVLTSISITHSINRGSVVATKIEPILSPEYLIWRGTA